MSGTTIKNREVLQGSGDTALRRLALTIAEAGIAYADPGNALRRFVALEGDTLVVEGQRYSLADGVRVYVVGAGKASFPIAKALDELLGARIHKGLVTCKYGQEGSLEHIELRLASHPIPDEASLNAALTTVELLREVRAGDIVIGCFTGGSSSLFVAPVPGVSLQEKALANDLLLTCGANIVEINDVRKHLSSVKGGRLIRSLAPGAVLINLTVSDVIGDALDYITDPSVPDRSTFADAQAVLDKYNLWDRMPVSIAAFLAGNQWLTLALLTLPASLAIFHAGPSFALVQELVPLRLRALAAAFLLFCLNVIGGGLGPFIVGLLSDLMAPSLGRESLRYAMMALTVPIVLSVLFYYLAARRLKRDLAEAHAAAT